MLFIQVIHDLTSLQDVIHKLPAFAVIPSGRLEGRLASWNHTTFSKLSQKSAKHSPN